MAERHKVSHAALIELLIAETKRSLGRDASFLLQSMAVEARDGEPNWDANIGTTGAAARSAFLKALARVREHYNLDEASHRRLRSSGE